MIPSSLHIEYIYTSNIVYADTLINWFIWFLGKLSNIKSHRAVANDITELA